MLQEAIDKGRGSSKTSQELYSHAHQKKPYQVIMFIWENDAKSHCVQLESQARALSEPEQRDPRYMWNKPWILTTIETPGQKSTQRGLLKGQYDKGDYMWLPPFAPFESPLRILKCSGPTVSHQSGIMVQL